MIIVGIEELLKLQIKPHMEMFEASLHQMFSTEDYIKTRYEEEEKKCADNVLNRYPEMKALYLLEQVYGPFYISNNVKFDEDKDTICIMLFEPKFTIKSEKLRFYDKKTRFAIDDYIYGDNIIELCKSYINKCMDSGTLIRSLNKEGEGYATYNVRDIIVKSGVDLVV